MSALGTELTCRPRALMSADRVKQTSRGQAATSQNDPKRTIKLIDLNYFNLSS